MNENPNNGDALPPSEPVNSPQPAVPIPPVVPQIPVVQSSSVITPQVVPVMGQPITPRPIDTKIGLLRNWAILFAIISVSFLAAFNLGDISINLYNTFLLVIFIVLIAKHITELAKQPQDTLTEKDRTKMVINLSIGLILAQAIYYYKFRKSKPTVAKVALRIGWKIFMIWFAIAAVLVVWLMATSWEVRHTDTFNAKLKVIRQDANELVIAAKANDLEKSKNKCQDISDHTKEMRQIPPYPNEEIQKDIAEGQNKIINGAGNCVRGIEAEDAGLIKQAAVEVTEGAKLLNSAIGDINKGPNTR